MRENDKFTPYFVADRQASLRILQGVDVPDNKEFGIMSHANTSESFQEDISDYPCFDLQNCGVVDDECPYGGDVSQCEKGKTLLEEKVLICDSGVFQKEGSGFLSYNHLFKIYEKMGADYGIMIDVLKDKKATLESARDAIEDYEKGNWSFRLIGVAQGNSAEEYLSCYDELREMGFDHAPNSHYPLYSIERLVTKLKDDGLFGYFRTPILLRACLSSPTSVSFSSTEGSLIGSPHGLSMRVNACFTR